MTNPSVTYDAMTQLEVYDDEEENYNSTDQVKLTMPLPDEPKTLMDALVLRDQQDNAWIERAMDYVYQCQSISTYYYSATYPRAIIAWRYQNYIQSNWLSLLGCFSCGFYDGRSPLCKKATTDQNGDFTMHDPDHYPFNPHIFTPTGQTHQQFYAMLQRKTKPTLIDRGYYAGCTAKWAFIDDSRGSSRKVMKTVVLYIEDPPIPLSVGTPLASSETPTSHI